MIYTRRNCISGCEEHPFHRDPKLSDAAGFEVFTCPENSGFCISLHTGKLQDPRKQKRASSALGKILAGCLTGKRILAAGIGNPLVTPDSLGPRCISLLVPFPDTEPALFTTAPDIPARTGMDTALLVRGTAETARADCIITVDALAAQSEESLASAIQITDMGNTPGSGTDTAVSGEISTKTMGIPVISVGVPTVIDRNGLLVTNADCDSTAEIFSRVIAYGILNALSLRREIYRDRRQSHITET
ncbi:MAG: GPR endopeptidase [Clostridia bacterium]|nr:GPR endopeptidase [Clostridia bacterium]